MARASSPTLLPLDSYARIMGIGPVYFNGGGPISIANRILFPMENASNLVWPQYAWQNHDQVCREEVADEIMRAEDEVGKFLRFNIGPTWIEGEMYELPRHYSVDVGRNYYDVTGDDAGIELRSGKFIESGRRVVTLLNVPAVVYSDDDGDGWSETATVTVALTSNTDIYTYKVFFVGHNGEREWEIRPPKYKQISGANIVIKFPTYMMVDPDLWEVYATDDNIGKSIDMSDMTNFVTTVDVYQEINDFSEVGVEFYSVVDGSGVSISDGFLYKKQAGDVVVPLCGSYDTVDNEWDILPLPDDARYVKLWYYAGARTPNLTKSFDYISDTYARAISYLVTARLERPFYANTNATQLAEQLRQEMTVSERGQFRMVDPDIFNNPFGSRVGEYKAYKLLRNFGERVARSAVV